MMPFKVFPPGRGTLLLPATSRSAALAGLTLLAASRPAALLAQRAAWLLVRGFGPRALPGRTRDWTPPFEAEVRDRFHERLADAVGGFDALAVYQPRQRERSGFCVLLLRRDEPVGFVKVRAGDGARLAAEHAALAGACRAPAADFRAPEPIAAGTVGAWHYLVTAPLPAVLHRPPTVAPVAAIAASIGAALATLPRPAGVPAHWRPMHGDFTPWNLRQAGRALFLVDWEDAGWAPPRADEVYYRATEAALRRRPPVALDAPEAACFWWERVAGRAPSRSDAPLRAALLATLGAMGGDLPPSRAEPAPAAS